MVSRLCSVDKTVVHQAQSSQAMAGNRVAWRADSPFRWMDVLSRLDSLDTALCQVCAFLEATG